MLRSFSSQPFSGGREGDVLGESTAVYCNIHLGVEKAKYEVTEEKGVSPNII